MIQTKVAAGRAGAVARQKQLLEQLQAAKESFCPPVSAADNDGTSDSPKEAKRTDERPEPNWIPWIIGACLAEGFTCVCRCGRKHARRWQLAPRPKSRINLPNEKLARLSLYGARP